MKMGTFSFWHFLGKLEADLWYVFIWKDTNVTNLAQKSVIQYSNTVELERPIYTA